MNDFKDKDRSSLNVEVLVSIANEKKRGVNYKAEALSALKRALIIPEKRVVYQCINGKHCDLPGSM